MKGNEVHGALSLRQFYHRGFAVSFTELQFSAGSWVPQHQWSLSQSQYFCEMYGSQVLGLAATGFSVSPPLFQNWVFCSEGGEFLGWAAASLRLEGFCTGDFLVGGGGGAWIKEALELLLSSAFLSGDLDLVKISSEDRDWQLVLGDLGGEERQILSPYRGGVLLSEVGVLLPQWVLMKSVWWEKLSSLLEQEQMQVILRRRDNAIRREKFKDKQELEKRKRKRRGFWGRFFKR